MWLILEEYRPDSDRLADLVCEDGQLLKNGGSMRCAQPPRNKWGNGQYGKWMQGEEFLWLKTTIRGKNMTLRVINRRKREKKKKTFKILRKGNSVLIR